MTLEAIVVGYEASQVELHGFLVADGLSDANATLFHTIY
jgi:hypothetical protein